MAFQKEKKQPQFADLVGILAQTKNIDSALYQTVQEIINRLDQFTAGGSGGKEGERGATGPSGPEGPEGPQGPVGPAIDIKGSLPSAGSLPPTGEEGDAWITADTGHLWVWDETTGTWIDAGLIQGPPGNTGPQGPQGIPGEKGDKGDPGIQGVQGIPGTTPTLDQSFITVNDEPTLVNERRLVAGSNITLSTATSGQIIINGQGGGMNLDYLGDYVTPQTYNDGDIVIGSDGIAYMCVVDGTVTPPEPWPGIGISTVTGPQGPAGPTGPPGPAGTGGIVDALYWVVTPHAGLTNERALSLLTNGYVKSTGGEPSVVATIPLTDTTGILPDNRLTSNVALKNIDNSWLVAQTFPSNCFVSGLTSTLYWRDTSGIVDQKVWRIINFAGDFYLDSWNDAITVLAAQYKFGRTGLLTAPSFQGNGANLTALNASALATGLAPPLRLGSGTPNSTTFLRGDSTWAVPGGIPSGMIVLSSTPCPPGWTRVGGAGIDGSFMVISNQWGLMGGSNSHSHPAGTFAASAHTHGAGSYTTSAHSHGGSTGTVSVSMSGSTGSGGSHTHPFDTSLSGNTGGESAGILSVDGGASGNCARGPHTHSLSGVNVSGTTDSVAGHTHPFSGSGSGTGSIPSQAGLNITGTSSSDGAGAITGTSAAASNIPLFFSVILCYKD